MTNLETTKPTTRTSRRRRTRRSSYRNKLDDPHSVEDQQRDSSNELACPPVQSARSSFCNIPNEGSEKVIDGDLQLLSLDKFDFMNTQLSMKHQEVSYEFKEELSLLLSSSHRKIAKEPSTVFEDGLCPITAPLTPVRKVVSTEDNTCNLGMFSHSSTVSSSTTDDDAYTNEIKFNYSNCTEFDDILELEIFGSSVTNLVLPGKSDVDINVSISDGCKKSHHFSLTSKQRLFNFVYERISCHPRIQIVEVRPFARVPIIKVLYHTIEGESNPDSPYATIQGDVTFSHSLPRYNSNLLKVYGQQDPLVRRLMLLTKQWASARGVKDASKGFLSSYSFMLLVVFYAQQRMSLPVLQKCDGAVLDKFNVSSVRELSRTVVIDEHRKPLEVLEFPDCQTDESMNIEELSAGDHCVLFLGFLEFLSTFPFDKYAISVRNGEMIPRPESTTDAPWRWSIEDPFEHFQSSAPRDLGSVLREYSLAELQLEISRGISLLRRWYFESTSRPSPDTEFEMIARENDAIQALTNLLAPCSEEKILYRSAYLARSSPPCRSSFVSSVVTIPDEKPADSTSEDIVQKPNEMPNETEGSDNAVPKSRYTSSNSDKLQTDGRSSWMYRDTGNLSSSSVISFLSETSSNPRSETVPRNSSEPVSEGTFCDNTVSIPTLNELDAAKETSTDDKSPSRRSSESYTIPSINESRSDVPTISASCADTLPERECTSVMVIARSILMQALGVI